MDQIYGRCLIDGELVDAPRRGEVHNPADTSEVVGTYPLLAKEEVDRAVASARHAQWEWAQTPAAERAKLVLDSAHKVAALDGIDEILIREQGKVGWEATFELGYYEALADAYAGMAGGLDEGESLLSDALGDTVCYRRPVGVVAAVTPWNYPLGLMAMKLVPALIAGCAVVVKPSPVTPLSTLESLAALVGHFPRGVVSVVTGTDEEVSRPLLAHPDVRKITLTGSTPTGRIAVAASAPSLKNVTLELGGNDAALVLDDMPIDDDLCGALATGAFTTTGQVCVAIKRVYIRSDRVDELAEGLTAALADSVVGNGLDPASTLGPLTTSRQHRIVTDLVADAETAGARVRYCGDRGPDTQRGYFLRPAIVTGAPENHDLVQQEQFGPALPVQPYEDVDQAIALINASEYGLTSSVWSTDREHAARIAQRIEAGTVHVNTHGLFAMDPRACFGGVKQSGLGREMGIEGLHAFTEARVVNTRAV
ncbi:aldehyde dehydrogenase family protein [Sciscionella marina]|uniref:aldehyde dehydrogenase family protein n=1 Tax=Sciscionella marina TaxID=508770 RepID=UPI000372B121|nr:aldehyde dehydrogenase family protein [Sciscionella marina]